MIVRKKEKVKMSADMYIYREPSIVSTVLLLSSYRISKPNIHQDGLADTTTMSLCCHEK